MIFINPRIEPNILINHWRKSNHAGNCFIIINEYNDDCVIINYINNVEVRIDPVFVGHA